MGREHGVTRVVASAVLCKEATLLQGGRVLDLAEGLILSLRRNPPLTGEVVFVYARRSAENLPWADAGCAAIPRACLNDAKRADSAPGVAALAAKR